MVMIGKKLLACVLLPSIASAHLSVVCTSAGYPGCNDFNIYFGTYHDTPRAGGSVPGTFYLQDPLGKITSGKFNTFKPVNNIGGSYIKDNDFAHRMHESLTQEWGLHANDSVHCYGTLDATNPTPLIAGTGTSATVYGTRIIPPEEQVDTCFQSVLQTWYRATVRDATSGQYIVWKSGTDVNLDPAWKPAGSPCTVSKSIKFAFDLTACDGGKPCPPLSSNNATAIEKQTGASIPTSCKKTHFSGYACPATCTGGKVKIGSLACDDGQWVNTLKCTDTPCSQPTSSDYSKITGVAGPDCGIQTAQGVPCVPKCPIGWYAPPNDRLTCGDGGKWKCTQVANSNARVLQPYGDYVSGNWHNLSQGEETRRLATCGCVQCPNKDGLECAPPTTSSTSTTTTTTTLTTTTTSTTSTTTTTMTVTTTTTTSSTSTNTTTTTVTTTTNSTTSTTTTTTTVTTTTTTTTTSSTSTNTTTTTVTTTTTSTTSTTNTTTTVTTTMTTTTEPVNPCAAPAPAPAPANPCAIAARLNEGGEKIAYHSSFALFSSTIAITSVVVVAGMLSYKMLKRRRARHTHDRVPTDDAQIDEQHL